MGLSIALQVSKLYFFPLPPPLLLPHGYGKVLWNLILSFPKVHVIESIAPLLSLFGAPPGFPPSLLSLPPLLPCLHSLFPICLFLTYFFRPSSFYSSLEYPFPSLSLWSCYYNRDIKDKLFYSLWGEVHLDSIYKWLDLNQVYPQSNKQPKNQSCTFPFIFFQLEASLETKSQWQTKTLPLENCLGHCLLQE